MIVNVYLIRDGDGIVEYYAVVITEKGMKEIKIDYETYETYKKFKEEKENEKI